MRKSLCALLLLLAFHAGAESFRSQVSKANELLRNSEPGAALEIYREIEKEHPESPILQYNIGVAQSQLAELSEQHDLHHSAQQSFDSANVLSSDRELDKKALRAAVKSSGSYACDLAQAAADNPASTKEAIGACEAAIGEFDRFLNYYQDDAEALQSKKFLEYQKHLLQQQAEQQPKSGEDQEKKEPGEEQQQQNGDQPQPEQDGEQQKEEGEQNSDGEEPGDEEQPKQDQTGEQPYEEPGDLEQNPGAQEGGEQQGPPPRQTLEAMLESLEAQDNKQQHELRRVPPTVRFPREWW